MSIRQNLMIWLIENDIGVLVLTRCCPLKGQYYNVFTYNKYCFVWYHCGEFLWSKLGKQLHKDFTSYFRCKSAERCMVNKNNNNKKKINGRYLLWYKRYLYLFLSVSMSFWGHVYQENFLIAGRNTAWWSGIIHFNIMLNSGGLFGENCLCMVSKCSNPSLPQQHSQILYSLKKALKLVLNEN